MTKRIFPWLLLAVVCGSLAFRTIRLDIRPMHHDEANQAYKFGELLEKGSYRYDREEHHGPSLYYLTLPFAWGLSGNSFADLDEWVLRLVPALFGAGLCLLLWILAGRGLPREVVVLTALMAGISPAMTYYGRTYIQETLLVFFLVGLIVTGWRYILRPSGGWAAGGGFFAGMVYATKETGILLFGALAGAFLISRLVQKKTAAPAPGTRNVRFLHFLFFAGAAFATAGLLFTSFLENPAGLSDSVLAFGTYIERAGSADIHAHPWYFYLHILAFFRYGDGPFWSEAFLLVLAAAGGLGAFKKNRCVGGSSHFLKFTLFFTLLTGTAYSLIPYKTPWNVLPFLLGILILAGNGAHFLWRSGRSRSVRVLLLVLLATGFAHLAYQNYRANFVVYADPSNPYVYAQTSRDFMGLVETVEEASARHPEGKEMLIKVIAPPDETWPLPWYLRRYPRVGYWTDEGEAELAMRAPVIISSASFGEAVASRLGETYHSAFYGLRPEVVLILFIEEGLWQSLIENRTSKIR